jgi:mono/diheme cytochrome c family protein
VNIEKWVLVGVAVFSGSLLGIQLVPYGRAHTNPPVVAEPAWDSQITRELASRACFDCHSNETRWPWYAHVAPMSWLVQDHVDEGREVLNFSEWNRPYDEADEAGETVEAGEMPMAAYAWLHRDARLTPAERAALIAGLSATLGTERE